MSMWVVEVLAVDILSGVRLETVSLVSRHFTPKKVYNTIYNTIYYIFIKFHIVVTDVKLTILRYRIV